MRQSKCAYSQCRQPFEKKHSTLQKVCSPRCAIGFTQEQNEKKYRARTRELKRQQKDSDRSYQRQRAQYWFNRFIRLRDRDLPCISCGRKSGAKMNAGHWKTRGAHPQHAFNEDNCAAQCEHCNTYLSGNVAEYRKNLIIRIGLERVESIENENQLVKHSIDDFRNLQEIYKRKCRELENEM